MTDLAARTLYEMLRAETAPGWDRLSAKKQQRWRSHVERIEELSRYEKALIRARADVGDAQLKRWLNE